MLRVLAGLALLKLFNYNGATRTTSSYSGQPCFAAGMAIPTGFDINTRRRRQYLRFPIDVLLLTWPGTLGNISAPGEPTARGRRRDRYPTPSWLLLRVAVFLSSMCMSFPIASIMHQPLVPVEWWYELINFFAFCVPRTLPYSAECSRDGNRYHNFGEFIVYRE